MSSIYLYNIVKSSKVLGAGNRFAIWVQGCEKRCSYCIVPDSWSKNSGGYYRTIQEIVNMVLETKSLNGITISGGEPFLQSKELCNFIALLNSKKKGLNYIIYTGLNYEELLENESHRRLIDNIDLLIDGEYIDELNNNEPLIGSSNQGVYILTDKGYDLAQKMSQKSSRELEVVVKDTEDIFIVGIPPKKINKKLKGQL